MSSLLAPKGAKRWVNETSNIFNKSVFDTKCKHQYCETCIKTWLKRSKCCPYCRKSIIKDDLIII